MPPKFKFTKEEIIDTAFNLVRQSGWPALSTRSLAEVLGTSARPIYSHFNSMDELEKEIAKRGVDLLYTYMIQERTGDPWQDHGIGYVIFAKEERCLFLGLNDQKHIKFFKEFGEIIWNTLTESLAEYPPFQGLSEEQIYLSELDTLPDVMAYISPLNHFDKIKTSVKLYHSLDDDVVPAAWAIENCDEMKAHAVDVDCFYYIGADHSFASGFLTDFRDTMLAFFENKLKGP